MENDEQIRFKWPFKQAEDLYLKLRSDKDTIHISDMYIGAAFLVFIEDKTRDSIPELIRQFSNSMREIIEKIGFISRGANRSPSGLNNKSAQILLFYKEKIAPLKPFEVEIFDHLENKLNASQFYTLYDEFDGLRAFDRKKSIDEIRDGVLLKGGRLSKHKPLLDSLISELYDLKKEFDKNVHKDKPGSIDYNIRESFERFTQILLKILPDHEVDIYEDIDSMIDIAEATDG